MSNKKDLFKKGASLAVATALAMTFSLNAQTATTTPAPEKKTVITGFFKADYVYSSAAVMSYGSETLVGQTHAKRQSQSDDKNARWGITPNQSRVSVVHSFSDKVKGVIETDLNGATGGPTAAGTGGLLRVRQAYISYTPNSKMEFFGGQTWDVFSPLNPHTYNATVALFTGGNTAFVRNQMGMTYKIADNMIFKAAVGSPSGLLSTGTAPDLKYELNSTPTLAASFQFNPIKNLKLYLSGITVDVKQRQTAIDGKRDALGTWIAYDVGRSCVNTNTAYPTNLMGEPACGTPTYAQSWVMGHEGTKRVKAGGYSFGLDFDASDKLNIKLEYTEGQNLASIGALGIGVINNTTYGSQWSVNNPNITVTGDNANLLGKMFNNDKRPHLLSIKEQNAWFSWNLKVTPALEIGTHHGVAKVTNPDDLAAEANVNKYATADPLNSNGVTGGKIKENQVHGIRAGYKPADAGGLTLFAQVDYNRTFYATRKSESGMLDWVRTIAMTNTTTTLSGVYVDKAGANVAGTSAYTLDAYSHHKVSAEARATTVRMGMMLPF